VPGLGTSFGRGGATTAQQDLQNSDAILIMGSSMAENHPVGFNWVVRARERGATIIHVDPRFTRTSAMADLWVPLRAGSDIVFLGALVNHVLANSLEFREYVVAYTNAATIITDEFQGPDELDGFFSGWNADEERYDPRSWRYDAERDEQQGNEPEQGGHGMEQGDETSKIENARRDPSLQDPRCVYQLLKQHYARYTPEMVEQACGVPRDAFLRVADAFCRASGPEKTAAICYAVGWTQHSVGVQIIRTAAILQLLLGNIGRPGGGILALRGHASIQGSTDIPTLYDILPGYLPMPDFSVETATIDGYIDKHAHNAGWWAYLDTYLISLLKAWYGDHASPANEFGYGWLPRITGDHSHLGYWLEMMDGPSEGKPPLEGLFVMGQNPAVGAPNSRLERRAMANLKWLVVRDLVENETATFWLDSPEVQRGEKRTIDIGTEVFFFPAAGHAEKEGAFTNTQRLLQWREKAVDPPGDARSDAWFVYHLGRRLKARAANDERVRNAGLNALTWEYPTEGPHQEPHMETVLREINGYDLEKQQLLDGFKGLRADGTTSCGCWIYSGVTAGGRNRALERNPSGPYGHGWGFAWPADRRILYNRASARPDGTPWSERKKLVWWDDANGEWTGLDTPDITRDKRPDFAPEEGASGDDALRGDAPFIMHADGVGWLWVPNGLKDGPLPTHYEPLESPVSNPLYSRQDNPAARALERPDNVYADSPGDPEFPHVLTTYRLTEHHTAGGMSRTLSHLAELQPELFAEISPELASQVGARNGDMIVVSTPRGEVRARALVTARIRPVTINGRQLHQVGLPYHFGGRGLVTGDVVNDLIAISQEPNVRIMEAKALVCAVRVSTPNSQHPTPNTHGTRTS
jgi:formate dehydrogenase major subunit